MPHAEDSTPLVNGEMPSSQFLSHLTSYPVVSDSISFYKQNPYGAKSLAYADSGYNSFVKPVLPYAQQPYGLVSPVVGRADELAAHGLDRVDATFPIITQKTDVIKDTALSYIFYPVKLADETREYVWGTWASEYKKSGGDGVVAAGKASVSTGLVVTADVLSMISSFLVVKKQQGENSVKEIKEKAQK